MSTTATLRVAGISKCYAAPVLKGIDLAIAPGEIVALTGENGAGKSTLSKILAGLVEADSGAMFLDGEPYAPGHRQDAERFGVRIVLQELSLIGTLSIAENLQLGELPARFGFIDSDRLAASAREQLARVGLTGIDPSLAIGELGIGQQQLVEIARGLQGRARLLILDEPTAMLTAPEVERLFDQIRLVKAAGVSVLYISHRLDELSRITDRIAVLRDGQLVADRPTATFPPDEIVQAMVGHAAVLDSNRPRRTAGVELLRVRGLSRGDAVRNVSFSACAGEILGVAGLVGSGRTEVLRLIFGADAREAGDIFLHGVADALTPASTRSAVSHGIGLLSEDRKSQGLLLGQSIKHNITIADLSKVSRNGWLNDTRELATVDGWIQRLRIRSQAAEQPVEQLSGGNQQKTLLARWLHRDCRVLLLDEPTRGVDIGARADIYAELDALAAAGKALVVVSSDLLELMHLCDRIAVMSAGALIKIFERGEWTEEALLSAAFAGHTTSRVA